MCTCAGVLGGGVCSHAVMGRCVEFHAQHLATPCTMSCDQPECACPRRGFILPETLVLPGSAIIATRLEMQEESLKLTGESRMHGF